MQPQQPQQTDQAAPNSVQPLPFTLPESVAAQAQSPVMANDNDMPMMADDGDLIEKDWVAKVKQIVTKTAHDPFEQSKQLTDLKADYLQKRYGKVIKAE